MAKWKNAFVVGVSAVGASVAWILALRDWVSDNLIGVMLLLVPFGILLLAGAFFLIRWQFKRLLRWYPPRK